MPTFFDLLKYAKTGLAAPDMTAYDKLKAMAMCGGGLSPYTIIGQPPISFKSDGTPLTSVTIKGNGQQNGTPSPQNIVPFDGSGERTGNLFNEQYPNISGTLRYIPIYVGDGNFTMSTTTQYDLGVANLFLLSGNVESGASTKNNGVWEKNARTVASENGYITVAYRQYTNTTSPADCKAMLNQGSTALPYEPYGYKIPLTCASVTTPLYLGEVSTVRRIKKMILDGTETVTEESANVYSIPISDTVIAGAGVSTHFAYDASTADGQFQIESGKAVFGYDDTLENFKAFLADQYVAGTPVTVWYVLASPTEGIINEPLYRIGDYADTLTTDTPIPTAKGSNTLTVDTTVQPSEVSITGNIKQA